ncbi:hypothetical protein SteCoe_16752 [Stentor coeruleus]|uniref:Uncharacterized protein n=1 Tax=Stentor coeruleus TaxID=5963 RepID=A0A1R2C0J0_9CILI|nr:hypothetical protein SteCoe_16752 [Stentor coeruleus]
MSDGLFTTETSLPENLSSLFTQMNQKISTLDSQLGKILQAHENEFLHAYRIHMTDIQKEIKSLRQTISQEELKRRRDEEILSRERERDWFRNEALRLDKICKEYMKSTEIWKSKAKMLEDDKKILEDKVWALTSYIQNDNSRSKSVNPIKSTETLNKSFITESASTLKSSPDKNYRNAIGHMRKELSFYKSWNKKLKSETTGIIKRKHNLENLFEECVEVARDDLKGIGDAGGTSECSEQVFDKFSDAEKRKILYTLIARPEICDLVKNFVFRSKKIKTPVRSISKASLSTHGLSSHVFSTPQRYRLRVGFGNAAS